MPKKLLTLDDIIVSIKLRLAELDLEIFDAKKMISDAEALGGHSCYAAGFETGRHIVLENEKDNARKEKVNGF